MAIDIKDGGVWKTSSKQFIKINGVWKSTDDTFIKVGGAWADTKSLSDTKLEYDMAMENDNTGTYLLEKNDPTMHKAKMFSGVVCDGAVTIPLKNTITLLGTTGECIANGKFKDNIEGWLTNNVPLSLSHSVWHLKIGNGFIDYKDSMCYIDIPTKIGSIYAFKVTLSNTSHKVGIKLGDLAPTLDVPNGDFTINHTATSNITRISINPYGAKGASTKITKASFMGEQAEVLTTTKSVIYYDYQEKTYKGLTVDGSIGKNLITDDKFADMLKTWKTVIGTGIVESDGFLKLTSSKTEKISTTISFMPPISFKYGRSYNFSYETKKGTAVSTAAIRKGGDFRWAGSWAITAPIVSKNFTPSKDATTISFFFSMQRDLLAGEYCYIKNPRMVEAISKNALLTIRGLFNNIVRLDDKLVTDADITYLNANPNAIIEMWLGKAHPILSFTKADITKYYVATEGKGDTIAELKDAGTEPIIGKWVAGIDGGMQNFKLKQDANGIPTALAATHTIEGAADGRYVKLPMVDPTKQTHLVPKCLTEIKGDITQVVDTVCPTPPSKKFSARITSPTNPGQPFISEDASGNTVTMNISDEGGGKWLMTSLKEVHKLAIQSTKFNHGIDDITEIYIDIAKGLVIANNLVTNYKKLTKFVGTGLTDVERASNLCNKCTKLVTVDITAMTKIKSADRMFSLCSKLKSVDLSKQTEIESAGTMFASSGLININISAFTKVTSLSSTFSDCHSLLSVVLPVNPTALTDMNDTFKNSLKLTCVSSIDAPAVKSINRIFQGCSAMVHPDTAEQAAHFTTSGVSWTNPVACP